MKTYTATKYLNWFKNYYITRGYPIDEINLFMIRNEDGQNSDGINDVFGIWNNKLNKIFIMKGSSDPGKYWTEFGGAGKYRKGVAHMCYGYHPKIWCVDKHKGKYRALCNRRWKGCKPIKFWRDANKNYIKDAGEKVEKGWIGLNLHRMKRWVESTKVGKYSAGCQTVANPKDYDEMIQIVCASDMYRKTKKPTLFSYNIFAVNEAPLDFYEAFYKVK